MVYIKNKFNQKTHAEEHKELLNKMREKPFFSFSKILDDIDASVVKMRGILELIHVHVDMRLTKVSIFLNNSQDVVGVC